MEDQNLQLLLIALLLGYAAGITIAFILLTNGTRRHRPAVVVENEQGAADMAGCLALLLTAFLLIIALALIVRLV